MQLVSGLLEVGATTDPDGIQIFFRQFDHDGDRTLRFSDFSKALIPLDRKLKQELLARKAGNLNLHKPLKESFSE